ncbi:hypothetical protein LUZ60_012643 [Juncus effusus]|nr:hypothetical protein LUZ60_012643 [Juncus effusus]
MKTLYYLLLLLLLNLTHLTFSINQEGLYLLKAKNNLDDPQNALADWNSGDSTPCNWTGIHCSVSPNPTVVSIDLTNLDLMGPFPHSLCLLPNLSFLSLSLNNINSSLSSSSLASCLTLSHLDLSGNLLVGPLPDSLADLPSLTYLDLSGNNISGPIPASFGRFKHLESLSLVNNLLSGSIPPFLSNVTTLRELNLSYNPFTPSPIPSSFSNLASLQTLWLAGCNLNGSIPESIGQLTNLTNLDVSSNTLSAPIPASLASLSNLVQLELYKNSLSGPIPHGLSNLSLLKRIDISSNQLEGPLPDDLFNLPNLESLHLYSNQLSGPIPPTISHLKSLAELRLFSNRFNGSLPSDLGKNSPLILLDLSSNSLSGSIPPSICDHGVLTELLLIDNLFSGSVPNNLARCRSLARVRLSNNRLTGDLPDGLWGLPRVSLLELSSNFLTGSISPVISSSASLSKLLISHNQFTGPIPSEIGSLSKLYEFSAANNRLTGPLPASLGELYQLGQLDLCNNSLSGQLLRGIKSWIRLTELNLAHNRFTGGIPPELGSLPVLNYLDLSSNSLTGEVPSQLESLKLEQFNLSYNQLNGPLPSAFATEVYRDSFIGNPGLCNDLPNLCSVSQKGTGGGARVNLILCFIFALALIVLFVGIALFYLRYKKLKQEKRLKTEEVKFSMTSFHKQVFSEFEILNCLKEENLIGFGASGKVYKAVLSTGESIAVKKINVAHQNNFDAEVAILGKIRHKNIIKLYCCYTHKDCKLLVYEYMQNGSLGDVLHGREAKLLEWNLRYKIALNAAEGLCYLHHDCVPAIVHRDVKSNNILLDKEFKACVADFGVAKHFGSGSEPMSVVAGSCGYIAPEYAYTLKVNEKSDIYSFGVVILELVTGKNPVDLEFESKDLVKWVSAKIEQNGLDLVFDSKIEEKFKEEMEKVLKIGLLCTSCLPINRPSMRRVVKMLREVCASDVMLRSAEKDEKLLSYYSEESETGSVV